MIREFSTISYLFSFSISFLDFDIGFFWVRVVLNLFGSWTSLRKEMNNMKAILESCFLMNSLENMLSIYPLDFHKECLLKFVIIACIRKV